MPCLNELKVSRVYAPWFQQGDHAQVYLDFTLEHIWFLLTHSEVFWRSTIFWYSLSSSIFPPHTLHLIESSTYMSFSIFIYCTFGTKCMMELNGLNVVYQLWLRWVFYHLVSLCFSGSPFRCWVLTKKFAWETQITSKYIIGMRLSRNVFNICKFYCCELDLIRLLWIFSTIHVFGVWRSKRKFSYGNAETWDTDQILQLYNPFFLISICFNKSIQYKWYVSKKICWFIRMCIEIV